MRKTVKLCFFIAVLVLLLAGCNENTESPKESLLDDTKLTVNDEGQTAVEKEPVEGKRRFRLFATLGNGVSQKKYNGYTPEDFPEANCTEVREMFEKEYVEKYPLRILELIVYETEEGLKLAFGRLKNRADISEVEPPWLEYWCAPGFKPIRGRFAEQGLDVETEELVIKSYWEYFEDREEFSFPMDLMGISAYYGTYNGYVVPIFEWAQVGNWFQNIGDIWFHEPSAPNSGLGFCAWKDGSFYSIADLYEQGLLTHEDLVQIAYIQKNGRKEAIE